MKFSCFVPLAYITCYVFDSMRMELLLKCSTLAMSYQVFFLPSGKQTLRTLSHVMEWSVMDQSIAKSARLRPGSHKRAGFHRGRPAVIRVK
ncbi:hypothetical protein GDO78_009454 [Eleutherodactylus coqui]|uniref:Uncharacterized protein n=1 Tax=Eleutherodactylus coqui TaxID=57060 RepID=A0A8J6K8C0_ELECQ|nr:hypothetical protein GDO78_009454 [Eleutherodactylus coqui]